MPIQATLASGWSKKSDIPRRLTRLPSAFFGAAGDSPSVSLIGLRARYGKRLLRFSAEEAVCIAQSFLNQRYSPVTGSISPFWRAGTPAIMA